MKSFVKDIFVKRSGTYPLYNAGTITSSIIDNVNMKTIPVVYSIVYNKKFEEQSQIQNIKLY